MFASSIPISGKSLYCLYNAVNFLFSNGNYCLIPKIFSCIKAIRVKQKSPFGNFGIADNSCMLIKLHQSALINIFIIKLVFLSMSSYGIAALMSVDIAGNLW